jgi:hypothetical protein
VLDQLLRSAVKQSDMRIDAFDDFAVEFKHKPQDTVRCRVLRPEVDGEIAKSSFSHGYLASNYGNSPSRKQFQAISRGRLDQAPRVLLEPVAGRAEQALRPERNQRKNFEEDPERDRASKVTSARSK